MKFIFTLYFTCYSLWGVETIDNRILIYLDIRSPINQPYKMLPPEVESARHFDLNITQWELPLTSLLFGRNVCAGL